MKQTQVIEIESTSDGFNCNKLVFPNINGSKVSIQIDWNIYDLLEIQINFANQFNIHYVNLSEVYKFCRDILKNKESKNFYIDNEEITNKTNKANQKTYLIKNKRNGLYKIGRSTNPKRREGTLQGEEPLIELVKVWDLDIEKHLHSKYSENRVRGEWFNLSKIQVKYICQHY